MRRRARASRRRRFASSCTRCAPQRWSTTPRWRRPSARCSNQLGRTSAARISRPSAAGRHDARDGAGPGVPRLVRQRRHGAASPRTVRGAAGTLLRAGHGYLGLAGVARGVPGSRGAGSRSASRASTPSASSSTCTCSGRRTSSSARVGRRCLELGLGIGLYADLAVSVDRGGAETWADQALYAVEASVGAPPDPFNLLGQDWGLPPWIPLRLQQARLRAVDRHAARQHAARGALRIDHVMALMRLFWVPPGVSAGTASTSHYPFDDLLGILALESQRNRCLVIGEDLGTVPRRHARAARGGRACCRIGCCTSSATRTATSSRRPRIRARRSPRSRPTTCRRWPAGGSGVTCRCARRSATSRRPRCASGRWLERAHDRARLLRGAGARGTAAARAWTAIRGARRRMTPALCAAVHRLLARSPALVVVAQLEDALGVVEQANLPGTTDEHPNWRRKLPEDSAALADDPRLAALGQALAAERPRRDRTADGPVDGAVDARSTARRWRSRRRVEGDHPARDLSRAAAQGLHVSTTRARWCRTWQRWASATCTARRSCARAPAAATATTSSTTTRSTRRSATARASRRWSRHCARTAWACCWTSCPTTWACSAATTRWWLDVLEHGRASPYADLFRHRLGRPPRRRIAAACCCRSSATQYGIVLERGELRLALRGRGRRSCCATTSIACRSTRATYPRILSRVAADAIAGRTAARGAAAPVRRAAGAAGARRR